MTHVAPAPMCCAFHAFVARAVEDADALRLDDVLYAFGAGLVAAPL